MSSVESCPVCKSNSYLNPHLKLLVSSCYHKLCDLCVNRIFSQGSAPCPTCTTTILRKSNFSLPFFDDLIVEKEVRIRRLISNYLNRREEDFSTLLDYNNYLETIEDAAFNLLHDVQVKETFVMLEHMRDSDSELLHRNVKKQQEENLQVAQSLKQQAIQQQARRERDLFEMKRDEIVRKRHKEELINELANSEDPAISILARKGSLRQSSMKEHRMTAQLAGHKMQSDAERGPMDRKIARKRTFFEDDLQEENEFVFDAMVGVSVWESPITFSIDFERNQWKDNALLEWVNQPQQKASGIAYDAYIQFMIEAAFGSLAQR